MSKALLILNDNSLRVVEPEKGLHYWNVLHGHTEPVDEEEEAKCMHIKRVTLPPAMRPDGYEATGGWDKTPKPYDVRPLQGDELTPPEYTQVHEPSGKDRAYGAD